MNANLTVSTSPHIRDDVNTRKIMFNVIIALIPPMIAGIYFFGFRALKLIIITVLFCVLSEYITTKIMKKNSTIGDLSAIVTGILLALNYPVTLPFWIAGVGGVIAIVIVKQLFGGLGQNFMNPALAARVILLISWPQAMTSWVKSGPDAVSTATPLAILKGTEGAGNLPGYFNLFIGNIGGCIGETSALAILIGASYLFYKKIITPHIPLAYIGTVGLLAWILGTELPFTGDFIYHILAGGLLLGAFYMATDYTTSPITNVGGLIMGIGCGVLTVLIRLYTNYPEGVSFAIILMNILVPLIDRYAIPISFGGRFKWIKTQ